MNTNFTLPTNQFNIENCLHYQLSVEVQFSRIRFAVQGNSGLLWIEDLFLGNGNDLSTCLAQCRSLFETHPILSVQSWQSVRLAADFELYTCVPNAFYRAAHATTYLAYAYPNADFREFVTLTSELEHHHLVTAIPASLIHLFTEQYGTIWPVSALAASGRHYQALEGKPALAIVSDDFIAVWYRIGKNAHLALDKRSKADFRPLQGISENVLLAGEITPYSKVYLELEQYYTNVTLIELPQVEGFPQDTPWHRYFTLLSVCAADVENRIELSGYSQKTQ